MSEKDFEIEIRGLTRNGKAEFDISNLYSVIKKSKDPGAFLQFIAEKKKELFPESRPGESVALQNGDYRIIDSMIDTIIHRQPDTETFYRDLWEKVLEKNPFLENDRQKSDALNRILSNNRIPYFQMPEGLKMSEETFKTYLQKAQESINQLSFVLSSHFSQRTERSSLINHILDNSNSKEEKAVLMAVTLAIVEQKAILQVFQQQKNNPEIYK